jgi:glycosyltransferase involved in cell wall biosynthesis
VKISCLMVTLDRPDHFDRSLACYRAQDYPDRELVVVCDGPDWYRQLLREKTVGSDDVRLVLVQRRFPLGELRNMAVAFARGAVVAQWDDDDLYHPARLRLQYQRMQEDSAHACFLTDQLQVFWDDRTAYWCDWARKRATKPGNQLIPGTLMAYKAVMPRYARISCHEDSDLKDNLVFGGFRVAHLGGCGWCCVYGYHGRNTYDRGHHAKLVRRWGKSAIQLATLRSQLEATMATYPLDPPLEFLGSDGTHAFTWRGSCPTLPTSRS